MNEQEMRKLAADYLAAVDVDFMNIVDDLYDSMPADTQEQAWEIEEVARQVHDLTRRARIAVYWPEGETEEEEA